MRESKEYIKIIELRSGKSVEQHKISKRPIEDVEPLSGQAKKGKEATEEEQTTNQFTSELQNFGSTADATALPQYSRLDLLRSNGAPDAVARPQ